MQNYKQTESFMLTHMTDAAHDPHHVYRVLNAAVDIAKYENSVDMDVLITACLLHDIGREKQFADHSLCHAEIGGEMAYDFLIKEGWEEEKAKHVQDAITAHRYRKGKKPSSIEAKILFDADKLEAAGAMGIVRTLIHGGQVNEPLYLLDDSGNIVTDGGGNEKDSFVQEYNYKLKYVYDKFYTRRGKDLALKKQKTAVDFYNSLISEINENYKNGIRL